MIMGVSFTVKLDQSDPWVTYRAPSAGIAFDVQPEVAMAYFSNKGLKPTFSWMDMLGEAHDQAFTVAKMMDIDLLAEVRSQVDAAIANGTTLADFKKSLIPKLQNAGWWGKKDVIDPLTGKVTKAQLGSARRLENIFRTNLQTAYSAGHWANAQATKTAMPYLMYDAIDDGRTRVEHKLLDETVLPVDSPFWDTHYTPNGYNCRCGTIQMSAQDLEEYGLKVSKEPKIKYRKWTNPRTGKVEKVPVDLDPGWDHNPGKSQAAKLQKLYDEKVANLPPSMRKAVLESQDALDAAKKKAISDEAQAVLDKIEDEKTKYLYSSLQQIKKTKAGQAMSPEDLLQAAKDKAAKAEASAALSNYKQAAIKGKKPSKKSQDAYDALPDQAQTAIDAEIKTKAEALKAEQSAVAKLTDIAENPTGQTIKTKTLEKLKKGEWWGDLSAVDQLAKVESQAAEAKAKASASAALSGYKKKVLEGKIPTPSQQKAFNALSQAEKDKFLGKIEAAKQKAGPVVKVGTGDPDDWSNKTLLQIGKQKGSNEGGIFKDADTGEEYYIKTPKAPDIARNEVLAAKLYELAGVDVPELTLIKHNGQIRIASKIVPGVERISLPIDPAKYPGLYDDFAVDAWLANWDVVGLGYDNLLLNGKKFYRIDVGGSLIYRAQGTAKGAKFGSKVDELNSLRDSDINPQSANVFGKITQDDIAKSAKKVAAVSDEDIRRVVDIHGPGDTAAKKALADKLIARKADLIKRAAPELSQAAKAAKAEAIDSAKLELKYELESVDEKLIMAIKGIAYRAKKGMPIEQKDLDRASQAFNAYNKLISDNRNILPQAFVRKLDDHYTSWMDAISNAVELGAGQAAKWDAIGTFGGYAGQIDVIEDAIKYEIPKPGSKKTYTDAKAMEILKETIGVNDYSVDVPTGRSGYANFSGMPYQMQRSISAYTGGYYERINMALRGESTLAAKQKMQQLADLINASLDSATKKFKGLSSRGISLHGEELQKFIQTHETAMMEGGVVRYDAFTSSSKGNGSGFGGNVILKIKGKRGVDVKPISLHPSENEILFKAGTKFFVDEIRNEAGKTIIHLTEA